MHTLVTPAKMPGFTLIELLVVLSIVGVLAAIGAPAMGEFLADQRVRAAASDLVADIAFARVKAIESSRRVHIQRLTTNWNQGWRIYADLNNNGAYDAGEEIKIFNGYPTTGRMYICSNVVDFAAELVFRPDGRVVRDSSTLGANDGLYLVDTMGDGSVANNKIRGVVFGLSGRAHSINLNGTAPLC